MDAKQYAPSMIFTEREVRKTVIGTLGQTKTGMILPAGNGPANKITNITSEEQLVDIFGIPTEHNYKDWFNAAAYLKYASDLYVVRPINTTWTNANLNLSVSGGVATPSNSTVSDMYNEDIAENTLFTRTISGTNAIEFINKYINDKNEIGVLVCSKETDYDLPILESNLVSHYVSSSTLNTDSTSLEDDFPLEDANHGDTYLVGTGAAWTSLKLNKNNSNYVNVITNSTTTSTINSGTKTIDLVGQNYSGALVAGQKFTLAGSTGSDGTYTVVTCTLAGSDTEIVVSEAIVADANLEITATITPLWSGVDATHCPTYITVTTFTVDVPIFNREDAKFYTLDFSENSPLVAYTTQPLYYLEHKDSNSLVDYIVEQDFVSSMYNSSTKKLKTFREIVQKAVNFINAELAVIVIEKDSNGLWNITDDIFVGSYDPSAKYTSGLTKSISKVINNNSKYVYCVANTTYTNFVNTWSTKDLELSTVIITDSTGIEYYNPATITNTYLVEAAENFGLNGQLQPELLIGFDNEANSGWLDTMAKIAGETGFSTALIGISDETGIAGAKESVINAAFVDMLGNARTDTSFGALTEFNSYTMTFNMMKLYWDKYNEVYRWTPIVGNIAGMMTANDENNGAQSAVSGTTRGRITDFARLIYSGNYDQNILSKNGINGIIFDYEYGYPYLFDYITNTQEDLITREANVRRMIVKIKHFLRKILKGNYFEYNNEFLRNKTLYQINQVFQDFKDKGGLIDYELICNEKNNDANAINQQQFILDIKLQPGRLVKHISINIKNYDAGIDIREVE